MKKQTIFHLKIGGKTTTHDLLAAVKSGIISDGNIIDSNFPVRPRFGHTKIKLVDFDSPMPTSSRQALEEADRIGLERPTYEDALRFVGQFPKEQWKKSIVFLHEPVFIREFFAVIVLFTKVSYHHEIAAIEAWNTYGESWNNCVFAFGYPRRNRNGK